MGISRPLHWMIWWPREVLRGWSQPRWNSACELSRTSNKTACAFTTSGAGARAACTCRWRAERQYHAVEPENRLVAGTLEARWEDALGETASTGRRGLPSISGEATGDAERRGSRAYPVSFSAVATLWHAPRTSAVDRKQIVRCVVERVVVVADKATELNDVTIIWHGGVTTRTSGRSACRKLRATERLPAAHGTNYPTPSCQGLHLSQIAAKPQRGRFRSASSSWCVHWARNRGFSTRSWAYGRAIPATTWSAKNRMVDPRSVSETRRHPPEDPLLGEATWVHSRRTPSKKHLIVWADKDELRRLRQLSKQKSLLAPQPLPGLVIPKPRPVR